MYNKVTLVGHFTRDVELRHLPSGSPLGKTGIASNHVFKRQDGSRGEETCFIDLELWGRTAEIASQYLHRGSKVLIEGRLKFETWSDQQGNKKSKHAIVVENLVMLDSKRESQGGGAWEQKPPLTNNYNSAPKRETEPIPEINISDDMPF
ncbi:single-stranded DNA-binding protein [Helicobacter felis]|uniref:Single-stranded DNA-binding protein n=1 Tax=Helicobacter felis (strain ATCC 49179 / CCUG 28539 / NCTC 12436 / CS1) TaxID=936155 RepID=E7AD95_HELFC|nr:single-stranded DNA-binding protein [Helicobacter felis]CBY83152.1 single-strand DNA binding protein [Helicobacter felis ATCC 49179]